MDVSVKGRIVNSEEGRDEEGDVVGAKGIEREREKPAACSTIAGGSRAVGVVVAGGKNANTTGLSLTGGLLAWFNWDGSSLGC